MVQKIFVQLTADVLEVLLATSFCFAGEGAAAYDPAEISSASLHLQRIYEGCAEK